MSPLILRLFESRHARPSDHKPVTLGTSHPERPESRDVRRTRLRVPHQFLGMPSLTLFLYLVPFGEGGGGRMEG